MKMRNLFLTYLEAEKSKIRAHSRAHFLLWWEVVLCVQIIEGRKSYRPKAAGSLFPRVRYPIHKRGTPVMGSPH